MTYDDFINSLKEPQCPSNFNPLIQSLWWERKGQWDQSHEIAQGIKNELGSAIHAYLHRREGDLSNASYWYQRANRKTFAGTMDEECVSLFHECINAEQ